MRCGIGWLNVVKQLEMRSLENPEDSMCTSILDSGTTLFKHY